VFGKRAGQYAAEHAESQDSYNEINPDEVSRVATELLHPFESTDGENPYSVHEDLRELMQENVGIVRTDEDLREALEGIKQLRVRAANVKVGGNIQFNPGWHLALDLKNMLDISEVVTRAALQRTESRGAHTREDYPDTDPEWGKFNLVARQSENVVDIVKIPLELPPPELAALLEDDD
jgi:succinate dehydrogenase / fumarate reductase flavoprotein subunit